MIFSAIKFSAANRVPGFRPCALALCAALLLPRFAAADEPADDAWIALGQATALSQWHPSFKSPYGGSNSLDGSVRNATTFDLTLYLGLRLGAGTELYANPEIDEGFGLSNTLGAAGFPSGEAYKVGANGPYGRLPRLFIRQVINLGGEEQEVEAGANQLAGTVSADNLTLTVGKFSAVDIFDTNTYAHDPRGDFLNWSIIDAGAYDYAADAWGFTVGAAAEWTQSWWTLRGGLFDLSDVPNSTQLDKKFNQYEWVGEFEARHALQGHPGKVKFLAFVNRGDMGSYADAVSRWQQGGRIGVPDMAQVRHFASRPGATLNIEQELAADLGFFARLSANAGSKEAFEFTEINRSISAGLAIKGDRWGRHDDAIGIAGVVNALSADARAYFAAGGMGILIGDGQMNYALEQILETYYKWQIDPHLALGLDYQHIVNPAYNRDRGPVSILGLRIHADF